MSTIALAREGAAAAPARRRIALPIVLYPAATPVAAILYLGTIVASHPMWLLRPLILAVAISLVLTAALTALMRDRHRAGIAAWALLVGLLADDTRATLLLTAMAAAIVLGGIALRRTPWARGPRVTAAMSLFGGILVVASLLRALQAGGIQANVDEVAFDIANPRPAAVAADGAPDVYVLLLDAYPGERAARQEPTFDADAFPDALRARGFDVAAASRSNYLTTRLSLPSMFSGGYLDALPSLAHPGNHVEDARALRLVTDDGIVLRRLGQSGYERIAIASGFSEIGPNRVDRLIAPPQVNELEWAILSSTGVGDVLNALAPEYSADDIRARVVTSFDAAAGLAEEPHDRPRFVFAHVPAPHAPWVTDADGDAIALGSDPSFAEAAGSPAAAAERRREFYDYATWVNGLALRTIDRIVAGSPRPPVIVVFSDHGPDYDFSDADPLAYDLDVRTSNVIAVRTPDAGDVVPDDLTLVNLLPTVLDRELGWDLPLQADRFWAWPRNGSIVDFVELDPGTWKAKAPPG